MISSDRFLHTAASRRSSPRKQPNLNIETRTTNRAKLDTKRSFDDFASKWKSRQDAEVDVEELIPSTSSMNLFSTFIHSSRRSLKSASSSTTSSIINHELPQSTEIQEPRTPENQKFSPLDTIATPASVATSAAPALSPEARYTGLNAAQTPPQLLKYYSQYKNEDFENNTISESQIRPLNLHNGDIPPLRLYGSLSASNLRSSPSKTSKASTTSTTKTAAATAAAARSALASSSSSSSSSAPVTIENNNCGLCDMPLGSTLKLEQYIRMECGHRVHRQCREDLISISEEFGDDMPTCTVCSGSLVPKQPASVPKDPFKELTETSNESKLGIVDNSSTTSISSGSLFGGIDIDKLASTSNTPVGTTSASIASPRKDLQEIPRSVSLAEIMSLESPHEVAAKDTFKARHSLRHSLSIRASGTPSVKAFDTDPDSPMSSRSDASKDSGSSVCSEQSCASTHSSKPGKEKNTAVRDATQKLIKLSSAQNYQSSEAGYPIQLITHITTPRADTKGSKTQVALWIHAPELESDTYPKSVTDRRTFSYPKYRTSAKDVKYALVLRQGLAKLTYGSKPLLSAQLGILRLYSQVRITSPERSNLDWPQVDCYLFENQLILVTNSNNRVRAILDVSKALESAEGDFYEPSMLCLRFTTNQFPELHLHTESPAVVAMWKRAFRDENTQFPLHPTQYLSYIENLEVQLELNSETSSKAEENEDQDEEIPTKIVICLPSHLTSVGIRVQQLLFETFSSLRKHDKVAIVMYSRGEIQKLVGFQSPDWCGWSTLFGNEDSSEEHDHEDLNAADNASSLHSTTNGLAASISRFNFDKVLKTTADLLQTQETCKYVTSCILVSDEDTKLGGMPKLFKKAGIPVHTIGITESHNPLTLCTLSRNSGGHYSYATNWGQLASLLSGVIHRETRYVIKGVTVRLKSRIGARVVNFVQTSLDKNAIPKSTGLDGRDVEWNVGSMRKGDVRCLVFDIVGDIVEDKPLIQISVEHTTLTRNGDDAQHISLTRLKAPLQEDQVEEYQAYESQILQGMLTLERALSLSLQTLEDALSNVIIEENRQAFKTLTSGFEELNKCLDKAVDDEILPEAQTIIEVMANYFDQQCDNIINHKQLPKHFLLENLHRLWILDSRQSVAIRDRMEEIFY